MSTYHNPTGFLGFPQVIRNTNEQFPTINLDQNTTSGLGFFDSVGFTVGGAPTVDVSTSESTYAYYLRNLYPNLRSLNYVAVLNEVTSDDQVGDANFIESAVPVIYIYKGANLTDTSWQDGANWQLVTASGGSGTLSIDYNDNTVNAAATALNFISTPNEVTVAAITDTNVTDKVNVTVSLPTSVTVATQLTVGLGSNVIIGSGDIVATGGLEAMTATIGNYSGTETLGVQGALGLFGDLIFSGATAAVTGINTLNFTGDAEVNYSGHAVLKIPSAGSLSYEAAGDFPLLKLEKGTSTNDGTITIGKGASEGGSIILTPGAVVNSTAYNTILTLGDNGQIFKRLIPASVFSGAITFADLNVTSSDNSIIINPSISDITVNSELFLTTDTDQVTSSKKTLGSLVLTGQTLESGVYTNPLTIKGEPAVGATTIGPVNYPMMLDAYGVVGKASSTFVSEVIAGSDLAVSVTGTNFHSSTISVLDRFLRLDGDDENMFHSTFGRAGVTHYNTSHLAALASDAGVQGPMSIDNAYFEWIAEGTASTTRQDATIFQAGILTDVQYGNLWRIGGKHANSAVATSSSEELAGHELLSVLSGNAIAASSIPYAIQIGSGDTYSSSSDQEGLNKVTIPYLMTGSLHSASGNYLAGGGTLQGDWNVDGTLSIGGVTIDTSGGGVASVTTTGTLIGLGLPDDVGATPGNTTDTADIGIYGVYNHTDSNSDYIVNPNEAITTGFFRDASATMFNNKRPWVLVDGISNLNTTAAVNIVPSTGMEYAPLVVGGLKITSSAPTYSGEAYISSSVNGIVDSITSSSAWSANEHDLATASAIKSYVDVTFNSIVPNVFTSADQFEWGFGGTNESGSYVLANSGRLFGETAGGVKESYSPEELGLVLDFDTDSADRPYIGYLPGTTSFTKGTPLKTILTKIFTMYAFPSLEWDITDLYGTEFVADTLFYNSGFSFVETGAALNHSTTPLVTGGYNSANISSTLAVVYKLERNSVEYTVGGTTYSSGVVSIGAAGLSSSTLVTSNNISTADMTYTHPVVGSDLLVPFDNIGSIPAIEVSPLQSDGTLKVKTVIPGLSDVDQESSSSYIPTNTKTLVTVVRRSFFFTSNFSAREYMVSSGATLDAAVFASACDYKGDLDVSGSSALMHGIITRAALNVSGTTDTMQNLASLSGSVLSNVQLPTVGSDGSTVQTTVVKALSLKAGSFSINTGEAYSRSASSSVTNSSGTTYSGAALTSSTFLGNGFLLPKTSTLGTFAASALPLTAPNGEATAYTYLAVPIEYSGNNYSTTQGNSWTGADGGVWKVPFSVTTQDLLVKDSAGAAATFTYYDHTGTSREYVLFQTQQPAYAISGNLEFEYVG